MTLVPHRQPCVCRQCKAPPSPAPRKPTPPAQVPLLDRRGRAPAPPAKPLPAPPLQPPPVTADATKLTARRLAEVRADIERTGKDARMRRYLALRASGIPREKALSIVDAEHAKQETAK